MVSRPGQADGGVEDAQVVHDRLGAQRGVRDQEPGVLHGAAEGLGLVVHAQAAGHLHQRLQLGQREVLDQAEIEEGDPAAAVEQVVARVRVAVERMCLVQAPEHEPVDRFRGQVALLLGPAGQLGEAGPVGQLARHHQPARQLVDDPRDVDRRVTVVVGGQQPLVGRLPAVVELLQHAVPQLVDERVDVLAGRGDAEQPAQQGDVVEVGRHGLGDAGILHLHRDRAAVVGDRPVHLPDRRGGDRFRVPARERPFRGQAQLGFHHARRERRAHRGNAVLQPGQGAAGGGGQAVVHVAGHLADFHQDALHRPEGAGDVLGGLQRQVVTQLFPAAAGGREQPRRAAGVTCAAARGELQGREPPPHPQPAPPRQAAPAPRHDQAGGRERSAGRRRGEGFPHARCAARIRRAIRCRASSTPGSPRNTTSRTPSACRISARRAGVRTPGAW